MNEENSDFPRKVKIPWKKYFQILTGAVLLVVLYKLKLPLSSIILVGLLFVLLIFIKGRLYKKFDRFLNRRFHFLSKLNPPTKELIIVVSFVLFYALIKLIILIWLKTQGLDVQQVITDNLDSQIPRP